MDRVIVYWVEKHSGTLMSQPLGPHDLLSGSYEFEIAIKYANDPLNITVIPLSQLGSDWAKAAIKQLQEIGEEIRLAKS